jgi:HEAT repeat protein
MNKRGALVLALLALGPLARADKIDSLAHALMQDPAYKVRVQAALVLGKLGDRRAVPALTQALHDENETVRGVAASALGQLGEEGARAALEEARGDASAFVRSQAESALARLGGGPSPSAARGGARFYLSVGFASSQRGAEYARVVHDALVRELAKLPSVTLSVGGRGEPSAALLAQRHLEGYVVDGSIQRLSSASGQIDCDLKAFVATFPSKSIKMMTSAGASLQGGMGPFAEGAKRECLVAAVEAVRDDVGKFLENQR